MIYIFFLFGRELFEDGVEHHLKGKRLGPSGSRHANFLPLEE